MSPVLNATWLQRNLNNYNYLVEYNFTNWNKNILTYQIIRGLKWNKTFEINLKKKIEFFT